MKLNFNRNLIIGFGLSLVLLIISSVASLVSISEFKSSTGWVNHTEEVIRNLQIVSASLKDAETNQRGFLLTGNDRFLEKLRSAANIAPAYVRKVRDLTIDNPAQTVSSDELMLAVQKRIGQLNIVLEEKKANGSINTSDLEEGRLAMETTAELIETMEKREEVLLVKRRASLDSYGKLSPLIIILTAVISLGIALYFYRRVRRDYDQRVLLQRDLEHKDEDITRRIAIIQDVAEKISEGDYTIRTRDDGQHGIGTLSSSLNKMAENLERAFTLLGNEEWLQKGIRMLAESLLGVQEMPALTENILTMTAGYTDSHAGAVYLVTQEGNALQLAASKGCSPARMQQNFARGEGLAGRALAEKSICALKNITDGNWTMMTTIGEIMPANLIAIPLRHEDVIIGVLELGTIYDYLPRHRAFFEAISSQTGILINALQANLRVRNLLQETQAQSEELQAQHCDLENINAELEAQAQKLQASEEELRVQQEELMQANSELEERAHLLEDRNEEIAARTREISEKADALEQSTRYKSEFLANMSHELRTPLNSILLLSRLMADNTAGTLSAEQVEYATVIQSAGKGLLTLIDEILDLSKIEAGKMELEWDDVPLAEIAGNIQDLFLPVAREKGVALTITLADDLPDTIDTDEQRVEQILKNLLSNALKFTAEGSVKLRIEKAGDYATQFVVEDTGIGIAKAKQEAIFEAFQQEDGSTQRRYGGTGLGLAISRELARLLGGKITLTSEEGKGSVFTLIVPSVRPAVQAEATAPQAAPTVPEGQVINSRQLRKPAEEIILAALADDRSKENSGNQTLLIIEDDTDFAKTLLDITRKRGYDGIVAVRGDEGVELARKHLPAAILLDIHLPVMDGWEVMQILKADPITRHIPVHIISSQKEARKKSIREGAVDFIAKPIAPEDMTAIFQKIETVLKRDSKKVLILEENSKHATALASYLENYNITPEVARSLDQSIALLQQKDIDCVILDMGVPDRQAYDILETIKKTPGLEELPVIIYTGKSLSKPEEERIRQYADSIVVKTAHSYQRMLDEVSLFLHLVEQTGKPAALARPRRMGDISDVLKDKTILVADDDVRNIYSLSKALELHGVKVIAATDGKDALTQLAANPHTDLVLMDMMMPEMDGYETTTTIRRNPATKSLPVIAVTAKAMTGDREKCIAAGASDYITKPVDIDQLLSLLRVWLYEQ